MPPASIPSTARTAAPLSPDSHLVRKPFWIMTQRVTVMAGCVDVALLVLFLALGSPALAWLNLISIGMYACAYGLLQRRRNVVAVTLIWIEVLGHAAIGTWLIGWDSGFHYYLLMFIPAIVVVGGRRKTAPMLILLLFLFYIGMHTLSRHYGAQSPLSALGLSIAHGFNVIVVFAMAAYTARFYYGTVRDAEKRLETLASTDPLTGLSNRRSLLGLTTQLLDRGRLADQPASVVLADIDHFKRINDTHGHDAGDQVLVHVAQLLSQHSRSHDLLARWGGEEFLLILPATHATEAVHLAERMRAAIADHPAQYADRTIALSLSWGVAQWHAHESLETAIARADHALYSSKASGRNQVTVTMH